MFDGDVLKGFWRFCSYHVVRLAFDMREILDEAAIINTQPVNRAYVTFVAQGKVSSEETNARALVSGFPVFTSVLDM